MLLASKHFTPVIGIDIHIILTPAGIPIPIPHPFVGMILDIMDYVPFIGSKVNVNGVPRGNSGTTGMMATKRHIPMGGTFLMEPLIGHDAVNYFGSIKVNADGSFMTPAGYMIMTCNDIGIPLSFAPGKKIMPVPNFYLPTSMSIPLPMGKPVMVGGPYAPDLMQMIKGLAMSFVFGIALKVLGKALNKFVLKKFKATKGLSEMLCKKGFDPVDLITGRVMYDGLDFEIPGIIPIEWKRNWYSDSGYEGLMGHGFHNNYDISLHIEEADDAIVMRLPDGRLSVFPLLIAEEETYFNRTEKLTLTCIDKNTYTLVDHKTNHTYLFNKLTDSLLRPISLSNRDGFKIQFLYNGANQLKQIIDTVGRKIKLQLDDKNRVTKITASYKDETRTMISYAYNKEGDLIKIIDALEQSTDMEYKNHLMLKKTDRNGQSFYWEYDGDKTGAKCIKTWGDDNILSGSIVYGKNQNIVTNSLGKETIYYFNDDNLCTQVTDSMGNHIYHEYTEFMEFYRDIDEEGNMTGYSYDDRGNLTGIHKPDGSVNTFVYDDQDRLVLTEDAGGQSTIRSFDEENGRLNAIVASSAVTSFSYNEKGLIDSVIDNAGNKTALLYDEDYNLHKVKSNTTESSWKYDTWGRVIEVQNSELHKQKFSYDKLGRIVNVQQADKNNIALEYNAYDEVIKTIDSKNNKINFAYTPLGSLKMRQEKGKKVQFKYNTEEQLIGITNEHKEFYRFGRNAKGEIINETGFDGLRRDYVRDGTGKVLKVKRPDERFTEYEYDLNGRIVRAEHYDGTWETYSYDRSGNLIEAINQHSQVQLIRDKAGRVVKEIQDGHEVVSKYDGLSNRTKITSSLGAAIDLKRSQTGRVEEVSATRNTEKQKQKTWTAKFSYNSLGQEVERILPGGISSRMEYDFAGRPIQHRVSRADKDIRHRTYNWNVNDQLRNITDQLTKGLVSFTHDDFGNLASAKYEDNQFDYKLPDEVGNLYRTTTKTDKKYNKGGQLYLTQNAEYKYDKEGNLVKKITREGDTNYEWYGNGMLKAVNKAFDKRISFEYDALGRRTAKIVSPPNNNYTNILIDDKDAIITDPIIKEGKITRFVWDGNVPLHEWRYDIKDRPQLIVNEDGILEKDKPEPLGISVTQSDSKESAVLSSFITWIFDEGSFKPAAKIVDGEYYSIITDYLGTPIEMYDSQGEKTWAVEYDIYGKIRKLLKGNKGDCPFRYAGQYHDIETDLYYNRFRYYSPDTGVYLSQDPIGLAGNNPNFYAYTKDNNVWVDPFGLDPITSWNVFQSSTKGVFSSRSEASTAWKVYKESSQSTQELAIGRLPDTEAAEQLGMRRLNTTGWTENVNDAWVQGGIDADKDFYLASNNTKANRVNKKGSRFPFTVFDRELKQLENANYKQKGSKMVKDCH